jgi:probable F420-dependent oxidoreductase
MTGVLILPQRNAVVLAKEVATLDFMSGGRIELGIGVGWLQEEFAALGVPFAQRGRQADEAIQAMRALWAKDDASFQGQHVAFDGVSCNPKPAQGQVPIVIGGHTEVAARRAGRLGDGFFPATGAQVDVRPLIALMKRTALEHGRDPERIEVTTGCPAALPGSGTDPVEAIAGAAARGVDRVALPVAAFMEAPDPRVRSASPISGLRPGNLEARLSEFGDTVIRRVNG